jgi:hypothetical protein
MATIDVTRESNEITTGADDVRLELAGIKLAQEKTARRECS